MKLGVVGKGGTGKTTLSTLVALAYVGRGKRVVAVDTDSNPNLALSLDLDEAVADRAPLVPRALVVGSGDGALTPHQLLADYGLSTPAGVTLLHAMRVSQPGAGCSCAAHASVRTLLGAAIEFEADLALIDMEADLEHLSRSGGTLAHADVLLIVMERSRKSVLTAARTMALAEELGTPRLAGVGNRAASPEDGTFFAEVCAEYGGRWPASFPTTIRWPPPTTSAPGCTRPQEQCVAPSRPSSTSSSPRWPSGPPLWPRRSASTAAWPS